VLLVSLALIYLGARQAAAAPADDPAKILKAQAEQLEKLGDWGGAADKYEELLRLNRNQPAVKERYQLCLRRYFQLVRHRDPSYRKLVATLDYSQAMELYGQEFLNKLLSGSLDKDKLSAGLTFRKGLEEYLSALASPEYCHYHIAGVKPDQTRELRKALQEQLDSPTAMTYPKAMDALRKVVGKSKHAFPKINATSIVMEFLCGACHAVDEYTFYLTPRQLRELSDALKGRYVGIGVRLKADDNKILVAEVLADSPAAEATPALAKNDQIMSIDKKSTLEMPPDVAMELLEGEEGSTVELVVASPEHGLRIVVLRRRALVLPSVSHDVLPNGVGYIKIHCFQHSTLDEFEAKLADLVRRDCKSLILDLRGNPGGLLNVAVGVARRFLSSGVIFSQVHQIPAYSGPVEANNPNALTMPLVVLVDADTASAAEVLTGALKENKRARVVGQTTYGKGCSQGLWTLPTEGELRSPPAVKTGLPTGGIRLTIARFFSPTGQPYSGRGVEPDIFTEGESEQLQTAQRLLAMEQ